MLKLIKKIINIAQYILIITGLTVIIMFFMPNLIGITPFIVLSGSMEPTIKTGSIAYGNTHIKVEDVKVGDIIIFKLDKAYVTHRVVSINKDKTFTTKGDANATEDLAPVEFENFRGETIFSIPYLGYLIRAIQTPKGVFILSLIVGLNIIYFIFSKEETDNKEEKNTEGKISNK